MRRKNIAVVGMLLVTCLSSVGCGQKKDKQESLAATKTSAFETASEKQTEEKTEKETIKETSKETVKETETETEKETESKTEADTKTAVSESDELADGVYIADFNTDSSMFHVNEACDGKGTLTVKDGEMTIHVSLTSKKILNLYYGLAADAVKEGAQLLDPTTDSVTYSDGMTEEVYGFDIPVPALDEEFDVALIGTKGTWYDHKVSVSNPEPKEDDAKSVVDLEDGTYTQEELEMELEKVGSWTIPTAGYDETKSDYIGKLDSVLGETLNKEDLDMIYLLGGTPKMRQPFGVVCREGKYQIVTLDVVTGENDISAFSSEESQELNENSIYSFEQVKEVIESMPEVDDESDTGLAPTLKKENIKKERIYGVVVLLITVLLVGVAVGKKLKRKK